VPVAIEGAFEAWPRSGGLRLFVPILVGYGEPIRPDEVARMTREELQQRIRDDLVRLHAELKAKRGVG
jgi:1-acyl-sn-glycerol-3-phosphate acyltransferase